MDIDLTQSLASQPEIATLLTMLIMNATLYWIVGGIGAALGLLYGGSLRDLLTPSPYLALLGAAFLVASAVAPVPMIYGIFCLAIWATLSGSIAMGATIGFGVAALPFWSRIAPQGSVVKALAMKAPPKQP